MNIDQAMMLGLVQGLAEFLPISSSGHLFILQEYLGMAPSLTLEIWLHGASLGAIILFFHKKIWQLVLGYGRRIYILFRGWAYPKDFEEPNAEMAQKLLLATFLTVLVAVPIEKIFMPTMTTGIVAMTLIATGVMIVLAEKLSPKKSRLFTYSLAVGLGFIQGLAALPGISRSGITIAFLVAVGVQRKEAAEISFLLAIPTILGAMVFAAKESDGLVLDMPFWVGMGVSFFASLLAIKWMMKLVEGRWIWFAPYCVALGGWLLVVSSR